MSLRERVFDTAKNLASRTLSSYYYSIPRARASATLSINEWSKYFGTRSRPIRIYAGQEVNLILRPVVRVATERFRALEIGQRNCLLSHEKRVKGLLS